MLEIDNKSAVFSNMPILILNLTVCGLLVFSEVFERGWNRDLGMPNFSVFKQGSL